MPSHLRKVIHTGERSVAVTRMGMGLEWRPQTPDMVAADVPHRGAPNPKIHALVAILLLSLGCAGCGGWRGNTFYAHRLPFSRAREETTYRFGAPGSTWRPLRDVPEVQVAWVEPELAAFIELHVQCDEQGDSTLEQYTDHLRIDWTDWQVLEQARERIEERDALRTVVDGKLDGVPRRSEFVVLKKNGCLFDLRYSAKPSTFERGRADFRAVVSAFRYPP